MDSGSTSDKHLALSTVMFFGEETIKYQFFIGVHCSVILLKIISYRRGLYYLSCLNIKGTEIN